MPSAIADRELGEGEVLLAVDKFGLTANNVTYVALGELMSYWNFFLAPRARGSFPSGAMRMSSAPRTMTCPRATASSGTGRCPRMRF